jgi:hypothetical protein
MDLFRVDLIQVLINSVCSVQSVVCVVYFFHIGGVNLGSRLKASNLAWILKHTTIEVP